MSADAFLFWFLAILTTVCSIMVLTMANPVYAVLSLVMTMVGVSALFVTLHAFFLAGVQLIVYAGAVLVLFVMVLMLFDLKSEKSAFSKGTASFALKIASVGLFAGLLVGGVVFSDPSGLEPGDADKFAVAGDLTKLIGRTLFDQYVWGFEILGVLLLVVAVGCVAVARSKGGTHAS